MCSVISCSDTFPTQCTVKKAHGGLMRMLQTCLDHHPYVAHMHDHDQKTSESIIEQAYDEVRQSRETFCL